MATTVPYQAAAPFAMPGQTMANTTELKAAISAYMNRTDLDAIAPVFISLTEARIALDVRHWQMVQPLTLAVPAIDGYARVPADWLAWDRVSMGGYFIEYMTREDFQDYYINARGNATQGNYTMAGGMLIVAAPNATPDAPDIQVKATYYARIAPLADNSPATWLLTDYPMVYLYGCLANACVYVKDDKRTQQWANQYAEVVATVNSQSYQAITSGGPLRMRAR